jgi:hypothetical protein
LRRAQGAGRKLVIPQNMGDDLVEDLDNLLINDLTPRRTLSRLSTSTMAVCGRR